MTRSGSLTNPAREGDARTFGQLPPDRVNADAWKVVTAGLAPFGELDLALAGGKVHVVPGLRIDPNFVSVSRRTPIEGDTPSAGAFREDLAIEPRLAVRWGGELAAWTSRAAYGRYHQPAAAEDLSAVFGNPTLPVAAADHLLVGSAVRFAPQDVARDDGVPCLAVGPGRAEPRDLAAARRGALRGRIGALVRRADAAPAVAGGACLGLDQLRARTQRAARRARRSAPAPPTTISRMSSRAVGTWGSRKGLRCRCARALRDGLPAHARRACALRRAARRVHAGLRSHQLRSHPVVLPDRSARLEALHAPRAASSRHISRSRTSRIAENPEEIVYSANYRNKGFITGLPILPVIGARWTL